MRILAGLAFVAVMAFIAFSCQSCDNPFAAHFHPQKATEESTVIVPASDANRAVEVHLLDQTTRKDLWVIQTTKSHITFLPETGSIKIDGQLWGGPYRITDR